MEKTFDPNASRRCVNCRYYDVVTNLQAQTQQSICRVKPPRMLAQMIAVPQQDPVSGGMRSVPQWIQLAAWPVISPNDWCGRFSKALQSVDNRTPEQRLTDAARSGK